MIRKYFLDTETTGTDPRTHRIVEIGIVETVGGIRSGREFHSYVNPERDSDPEALAVHGLTTGFLADKPLFREIAEDVREFVGDGVVVAHNADFDMSFVRAEYDAAGAPPLTNEIEDTLLLARKRFPGSAVSLKALIARYGLDGRAREKHHGALVDADLLEQVYVKLTGADVLALEPVAPAARAGSADVVDGAPAWHDWRVRSAHPDPDPEEAAAHAAFLSRIASPIWNVSPT